LLLDAIAALGGDGPTNVEAIRAILADRTMFLTARAAAARALGALHDGSNAEFLKKVVESADNEWAVRVAAVDGLGRLGADLRRGGQDVGGIARYLQSLLEGRDKQRDTLLVQAALNAFGPVADPPQVPILFELIMTVEYCTPALFAAQRVMVRGEAECREIARRYLVWRAEKGAALSAGSYGHPDDILVGATIWWRPGEASLGERERTLKVVARVLAEANDDASPGVRRAAAALRGQLKVPGAPRLDPEASESERAAQVASWLRWWKMTERRLHISGSGFIPD
jgi:HEAT repeat protein